MAHIDDSELLRLVASLNSVYSNMDEDKKKIDNYRATAEKYTKLADKEQAKLDKLVADVRAEAVKLRDAMIEPAAPELPPTELPDAPIVKGGGKP